MKDDDYNKKIKPDKFSDYDSFPVKVLSKEESEALLKKLGR